MPGGSDLYSRPTLPLLGAVGRADADGVAMAESVAMVSRFVSRLQPAATIARPAIDRFRAFILIESEYASNRGSRPTSFAILAGRHLVDRGADSRADSGTSRRALSQPD